MNSILLHTKTLASFQALWVECLPPIVLYCLRIADFTALVLLPISTHGGIPAFENVGIIRHWHRETCDWFDDVKESSELILL